MLKIEVGVTVSFMVDGQMQLQMGLPAGSTNIMIWIPGQPTIKVDQRHLKDIMEPLLKFSGYVAD